MKKSIILLFAISLIGFASCEKNNQEEPGNIPGFGDNKDVPQVKEIYKVPEGISILGDITGRELSGNTGQLKSVIVTDSKSVIPQYGSGHYVRLKLTLLNTRNIKRTVFFPKGLVWQCLNGSSQHGIQCQTTWICLYPNQQRTVYIDLYCANAGLPTPDQNVKYKILGITSSKVIWDLLNRIGWRKINYEMIFGSIAGSGGKGAPTYEEITQRLQGIVYNLTDHGIPLSADDIAFLESIPELPSEERPVLNEEDQFPEYFDEFTVEGK